MLAESVELISAGHICLDITPQFPDTTSGRPLEGLLRPGSLVIVEPAALSSGGGAANVGLAAQRLGLSVALMGKCGDDLLGRTLLEVLRRFSPQCVKGMRVAPGEHTSYSVTLAVPGTDRMFLHCPGANDTFTADDVDMELVSSARLFYFGYPPLMAKMYADQGQELTKLFRRVKQAGVTAALDMALPDPHGAGGMADWPAILANVLPHVDVFAPSVEELTFMLRRQQYDRLVGAGDILDQLSTDLLRGLGRRCLELGAAAVMIKCGHHGVYACSGSADRIAKMGSAAPDPAAWAERELFAPSYVVENIASAAGAGDSAVAGFLAGLLRGADLSAAADYACAVGAQNVRAIDTVSGVKSWEETAGELANPRVAPVLRLD
jgi:sugar/nucleoside kinase (ribokinase family)